MNNLETVCQHDECGACGLCAKVVYAVECTGLYTEEFGTILADLGALWAGETFTPAGELFPILIDSIIDQAVNS